MKLPCASVVPPPSSSSFWDKRPLSIFILHVDGGVTAIHESSSGGAVMMTSAVELVWPSI